MAIVKYVGEEAVSRIADYVNAKLTIVSSMPESPDTDAIILYVGANNDPYLQGGIYKFDGTDWIFLGRTVDSLQDIFDIEADQQVVGDNSLEFIDGDASIDLSDGAARTAFEDSSNLKEFNVDYDGIEMSNTPVGGSKTIDFKIDRTSVDMNQSLINSFKSILGIEEINYEIIQTSSQLPSGLTPSDRKMYYCIADEGFYLWDGTQWVYQDANIEELTTDQINNLINIIN